MVQGTGRRLGLQRLEHLTIRAVSKSALMQPPCNKLKWEIVTLKSPNKIPITRSTATAQKLTKTIATPSYYCYNTFINSQPLHSEVKASPQRDLSMSTNPLLSSRNKVHTAHWTLENFYIKYQPAPVQASLLSGLCN